MSDNNHLIVEELGRTQTAKDIQQCYRLMWEASRQLAVKIKNAREKNSRIQGELEVFLDDVKDISGLGFDSPLYWKLVGRCLAARFKRLGIKDETDWFPNDW